MGLVLSLALITELGNHRDVKPAPNRADDLAKGSEAQGGPPPYPL